MPSLQPRRKHTNIIFSMLWGGGIVCCVALALWSPQWLDRMSIRVAVSSGFIRTAIADSADTVRTGMMTVSDVVDELRRVREENAALRIRAALYDEMRAERDRLYQRFGRTSETQGVIAHVLVSPARSPYDTFIIDAGSAHGIAVGNEVMFDTTLSIGVVEEVGAQGARVRLFSSPGVENQVSIGTSTAHMTAVGRGGGSFELEVPKDITVNVDDALMLAGAQRGALGFVRSVESRDADAFQTVYAASPINLFETREVLIITSTQQ